MRNITTLMVLGLLLVSLASAQVIGDTMRMRADEPGSPPGVAAGTVGAAGNITLYYWVAARYAQGLFTPAIPIVVGATVGVANLNGTDYVQIGWRATPFATGYYVIRTTTPFLTGGACTNCVVLANSLVLAFSDQGGGTTDYPPAGVGTVSQANFSMTLENADEALPYLRTTLNGVSGRIQLTTGTATSTIFPGSITLGGALIGANGAIFTNDENAFRWRTISEYFVGELASGYTDWSTRTGIVQAFGSRVEADMATVTRILGTDFNVRSIGGAAGTERVIGMQSLAFSGAGTTAISHVIGASSRANHDTGSANAAIGVDGILDIGAAGTLNALGFAVGTQGIYLDAAGVNAADNFTGAVMGIIWDIDTVGPDGAVVAVLNGDSVRTAGNSPNAAFKVMDRTTTGGVNFNYGLDLFHVDGAMSNIFNTADIRGQNQSIFVDEAADLWRTESEFRVGAAAGAFLDWSARTDVVIQGFRSRIESDVATATTTVYGGLFEVQAGAATAGGFFSGIRARAVTAAGLTGTDVFDGVFGEANPSDGLIQGSYGVFGVLNIDGTTAAGVNWTGAGVKGDYEDAVGLDVATTYTAGVMGFISDLDTVGPDGAVVAMLGGGGTRTAANSPISAFRIIDLEETADVDFQYGFDAYWDDGVVTDSTVIAIADFRGQERTTIDNRTATDMVFTDEADTVVGTENLANGADFSQATWAAGGEFAVDGTFATYTFAAAGTGTFTQSSGGNLAIDGIGNQRYVVDYTISAAPTVVDAVLTVTAAFGLVAVQLPITAGANTVHFESAVAPANFVFDVAGATAGVFTIEQASLNQVQSGDIVTRGTIRPQGITFADLPAAVNGTILYCVDCDQAAAGAGPLVCASTPGDGAIAFRITGAWTCLGI